MSVNFELLGGLLIGFVRFRIRNGECTERHLARLVGVSQPQLHNVLKGARPLKQRLADDLLRHFQISLLDLLEEAETCKEARGVSRETGRGESFGALGGPRQLMLGQELLPRKPSRTERPDGRSGRRAS